MSLRLGTGDLRGAAGVKTAKLCTEQDQIGRHVRLRKQSNLAIEVRPARGLRVRSLEVKSNFNPRGIIVAFVKISESSRMNRIRLTLKPMSDLWGAQAPLLSNIYKEIVFIWRMMGNSLYALWIKFVNQGTSADFSRSQNIAIQNSNAVLLWAFLTNSIYITSDLILWNPLLFFINGVAGVAYLLGLYLIRKGSPTWATISGVLGANFSIFFTTDAVGKDSLISLYSIAAVIAPFLMMDGQNRKAIIFSVIVGFSTFVLSMVTPDQFLLPYIEPTLAHSRWFPLLIAPLISLAMVYHTYSMFMRLLDEAEQRKAEMFHQSRMAALGEMASGIAHEINNPLQIIGASAFTIQEKLKQKDLNLADLQKASDRIENTTYRIARIVTGLLNFARGERIYERENSSIKMVISSTLDLCREKLKSKGVEIRADQIQDVDLHLRPTQISQIILNLINNSLDAISQVETKWIEIRGFYDGKKYQIEVVDSGDRIPQAVAEKMMQPFFTTKPVGHGTGLGLSISKGIIEEHGGRIYYDASHPDTKFVIEIPGNLSP